MSRYEDFQENKQHTDLFFPYNTYLCSIPLDFEGVPLHWHNETEFIVIKKGQGIVTVNLEKRRIRAGEIVLVMPGILHSIAQDGEETMEYENILFDAKILFAEEGDACTMEFFQSFLEGTKSYSPWIDGSRPFHGRMRDCIEQMDRLCEFRPKAYQLAVKGYLFQFFFHLFGNDGVEKSKENRKAMERIKLILQKIEKDYREDLTVEEMAKALGFSQSHFMKFFKANMGKSFVQYLNDYRLTRAARFLAMTSRDVLEIAIDSGFSNISYFNRLFKKKFHMTPMEYRKIRVKEL